MAPHRIEALTLTTLRTGLIISTQFCDLATPHILLVLIADLQTKKSTHTNHTVNLEIFV